MAVLRLVPAAGAPIQVDKDQAIVGREPACDVFVNDGSVSRRHARLERRGAAWFVVDQGSANGTYLDSQRVSDALLRPGQELRFGAVPFKVELLGDVPSAEGTILSPAGGLGAPAPPPAPPRPLAPPPAAPPPPTPQWPVPPAPSGPPPQWPAPPAPPRPAAPPPPMAPPPPAPRPAAPAAPPRPASPDTAPYVAGAPAPPPPRAPRPPRSGATASAVDAPPPAKAGRGPVFWVVTGCGGTALVALLAVATLMGTCYVRAKGPRDELLAHLENVRAGNVEAAYNGLSEEYRKQVSRPAFETFVSRHPAIKEFGDISYSNYSTGGGRALISGYLTSAKGNRETANFALLEEGGHWKISAMEVGADHPEAQLVQGPSGLRMDPVQVAKSTAGENVEVRLTTNVAGFDVRPADGQFEIDLAVDVETLGPDGVRIDQLSRDDALRFQRTTSLETGAVATITIPLTLHVAPPATPAPSARPGTPSATPDPQVAGLPPGEYTVRLKVRDRVGGGVIAQEAKFPLP